MALLFFYAETASLELNRTRMISRREEFTNVCVLYTLVILMLAVGKGSFESRESVATVMNRSWRTT